MTSKKPEDISSDYIELMSEEQRAKLEAKLGRKLTKAWIDFCKTR
jgi:hypothetical protein